MGGSNHEMQGLITRRTLLGHGLAMTGGLSVATMMLTGRAQSTCGSSPEYQAEETTNAHHGVPTGKSVILMDSSEGIRAYISPSEPERRLLKWLPMIEKCFSAKRSECDYKVYTYASAQIDDLKDIPGDCAALVYTGHGIAPRNTTKFRGLITSTRWNKFGNWDQNDWDNHLCGTCGRNLVEQTSDGFVYLTAAFVRQFWRGKFARNSFVYIDSCWSLNNRDFLSAIFDAGASVYAGWPGATLPESSYYTLWYVFDRLLGANSVGAGDQNIDRNRLEEVPAQRPFDWGALKDDMARKNVGKTRDPETGEPSELRFEPGPGGEFGVLRPSIQFLSVDELNGSLYIGGIFGRRPPSDRAEVTVGGQPLDIEFDQWTEDWITCSGLGPRSCGDVVLTINGKQSNPVPLTLWHGEVEVSVTGPGTLSSTVKINLYLRGHVHDFRERPGEAPDPQGQVHFFSPVLDSKASYTNEGMGHDGFHLYTYEGGGDLDVFAQGVCGETRYDGQRFFDFTCSAVDNRNTGPGIVRKVHFKAAYPLDYTEDGVIAHGVIEIAHEFEFDDALRFDGAYNLLKHSSNLNEVGASRPAGLKGQIRWTMPLAVQANSAPNKETEQ